VDEARPLLVLGERFSLWPAWDTFRSTAVFGAIGLVWLAARAVRGVAAGEMLVFTWIAAVLVATLGQNRFGYYLAPALALAAGWVCARLLDRAGVGRPRARRTWRADAAIVLVAALAFYPNLPAALLAARQRDTMPDTWRRALDWLREETPDPFGDPGFYVARYRGNDATRAPDYAVMSWWDYGYWVIRQGRRVPVTNPTQVNAGVAADFLVATTEADAAAVLERTGSRFVAVDRDLAFSGGASGTPLFGKFQGILEWTSQPRSRYYEGYFEADASGALRPVWIFYPDYYRSMAVRLATFGGEAVTPHAAWVITWARRPMQGGGAYREILASRRFTTYEEAETYRASLGPGYHRVAGRDPSVTCVPLSALGLLRPVHLEPAVAGPAAGGPPVGIFEVAGNEETVDGPAR
jgi:asparagine N-glycosylation enzyme membrane subunit Stt3